MNLHKTAPASYGVTQLLLSAWLADVLGMLLVCPALLSLLRPARLTADEEEVAADVVSLRFSILTVLVVLGIAALAYVLHRLGQGHYAGLVLFAVFVPMIWAAASQATGRADAYTLLLAGLPLLASRAYAVTDAHGMGFGETVSVSLLLCCAVLAAQRVFYTYRRSVECANHTIFQVYLLSSKYSSTYDTII